MTFCHLFVTYSLSLRCCFAATSLLSLHRQYCHIILKTIYNMSKGSLFWGNAVGKLGESVFYRANGQQRNRTYLKEIKNPKTRAQMTNRVKWANVINSWRMLKPYIAMGMQNRPTKQSDYNAFVSMNVKSSSVYLLKEEAQQNGSLLFPYVITRGTLGNRNMYSASVTSISVGNFNLASGTIGELSAAIIENNAGFAIGDQITVIALGQDLGVGGIPVVVPAAFKFILTSADNDSSAIDAFEISGNIAPVVTNNRLAWEFAGVDYSDYGAAFIQSRIDGSGQLLVSTSRISAAFETPSGNQTVNSYGVTLDDALNSYGYNPGAYLSPESYGGISAGPAPVLISAAVGSVGFADYAKIVQSGNQTVNLTGENFNRGLPSLTVDGQPVDVSYVNETTATASISIQGRTKTDPVTIVASLRGVSLTGQFYDQA